MSIPFWSVDLRQIQSRGILLWLSKHVALRMFHLLRRRRPSQVDEHVVAYVIVYVLPVPAIPRLAALRPSSEAHTFTADAVLPCW